MFHQKARSNEDGSWRYNTEEGSISGRKVRNYQKPRMGNDKVDNTLIQPYFYINEEATNKNLNKRTAFFIRNTSDNKEVNGQTIMIHTSFWRNFRWFNHWNEQVIYNYLFKQFDKVNNKECKKLKMSKKKEFKKILEYL